MTPTPEERAATLAAADRLNDSMQELRDDMTSLRTYGHRNRAMIWGVVVSLVLSVAVLVAVAIVAVQANNASSVANQNRQAAVTTCNAGNQARALSVQLWNYVLAASEQSAKEQGRYTPQLEKQIADFRGYIANAYSPRDCTQVGGS